MKKRFNRISALWLLCFVFHILAAWKSAGIGYYDEHFQIFEFLAKKLDFVNNVSLPWEYDARMRFWLQPTLYWIVARILYFVQGRWDPFVFAFLCRLLSACVGWFSLFVLWKRFLTPQQIGERLSLCIVGIFTFLWFFPYFHARTCGENLGASFLAFALCTVPFATDAKEPLNKSFWRGIFSGLLFTLSFSFRFQMAFAVLGALAWPFWRKTVPWKNLGVWFFGTSFGILMTLSAAVTLDRWGYGEWTFVPWNYFSECILQGKAAHWGVFPWTYYFTEYIRCFPLALGLVVLLGWFLGWICTPLSLFSWTSFSFFLAHLFVGHKEPRFLFPIIQFSAIGLVLGWGRLISFSWGKKLWKSWPAKIVFYCFLFLNFIALIRVCFFPNSIGILIFEKLFYKSAAKNVLLYEGDDPILFYGFFQYFYTPQDLDRIYVKNLNHHPEEFISEWKKTGKKVFLYFRMQRGELGRLKNLQHQCQLVESLADDAEVAQVLNKIPSLAKFSENVWVQQLYDCGMNPSLESNPKK